MHTAEKNIHDLPPDLWQKQHDGCHQWSTMFILPQHLNSPLAFCGVRFAQSLVLFCVLLIIVCIFVLFFFYHNIVCPWLIYGFRLHLWYFLKHFSHFVWMVELFRHNSVLKNIKYAIQVFNLFYNQKTNEALVIFNLFYKQKTNKALVIIPRMLSGMHSSFSNVNVFSFFWFSHSSVKCN